MTYTYAANKFSRFTSAEDVVISFSNAEEFLPTEVLAEKRWGNWLGKFKMTTKGRNLLKRELSLEGVRVKTQNMHQPHRSFPHVNGMLNEVHNMRMSRNFHDDNDDYCVFRRRTAWERVWGNLVVVVVVVVVQYSCCCCSCTCVSWPVSMKARNLVD